MMPTHGEITGWLPNALASAAQTAESTQPGPTPGTGGTDGAQPGAGNQMIWMLVIVGVFLYLMVLRPQSREKKQRQQMLDTMKKGDRVITIGGLHGKVVETNDVEKTVSIEVAPKVVVKYSRAAVQTIEPRGGAREGQDKDKEDAEPSK